MSALLTYALDNKNQLVHIDSVQHGGACQCRCPHCQAPLDAKNGGQIREHHFAHSHGHYCEGAYETALHLLSKQIILKQEGIMLPESDDKNKPHGFIKLKDIKVEQWDNAFKIRPDIEGVMDDGRRIIIECLVTHKINDKKYSIIIDNGLLCVEIDLTWLELNKESLQKFLTQESANRKWIEKRAEVVTTDTCGSVSHRNPRFDIAKEILKNTFDNLGITLHPKVGSYYKLSNWNYDICEIDANFRGFKTDLLLFRSRKNNKGFISINFRGRRRNSNSKIPRDLRIIDIIINQESETEIRKLFSKGVISSVMSNKVVFVGSWDFKNVPCPEEFL